MHKITDRMIVKAGVLAVLLCLAFGICFKYRYKLKEPVFLEQNTVVTAAFNESGEQAGWYAEIMLYYITGKEDDRLVQYIEFPELEQRNSAGENPAVRTEFAETAEVEGQYVLHALGGTLFIPSEALEREAEVTKGRVVYTDGSSREVSLGSILFEQRTGEETAAENASAHTDSLGYKRVIVRIKRDTSLKVKKILAPDSSFGTFSVTVNGEKLSGPEGGNGSMRMERKAGDSFAIESQWNGDNELADPSGFLSFAVVFELEGESSQAFFFTHSVEQPSGRDFINIWKYLKQRGAF